MKRGKLPFLLFFLFDAVYMLTVTATFSVFQYWQMNGAFRLFVLTSVLAGYVLWHGTAGRLVMACSEAIVRLLRLTALWLVVRPVRFVLGLFLKVLVFVYRQTAGRMVRRIFRTVRFLRSERIRRKLRNDISFSAENKRNPT